MRDRHQHLVEFSVGYRGDVEKRETMEFLVQFTDDEPPVWMNFDKDLSDTAAAFESYSISLPQSSASSGLCRRGQEEEDGHVALTYRRISPSG